jgi:type IV secretion system protein VirB11
MKGLMQHVPLHERIITIEDVPELFLPNHKNHVHLFYPSEATNDSPVNAQKLLKCTLRMKPDRIMLAELRGGETFDFINIAASGHGGSITSCHAGSCELTFERLALMVLQNEQGRELPFEVIRRLLYLVVDVVVHIRNDTSGEYGRHITEIYYDPGKKRALDL